MGMRERRRQDAAAFAITGAMVDAVGLIQNMAYHRKPLPREVFDTVEYQEQIRRLSVVCSALVPGLGRDPTYPPTKALETARDNLEADQLRWLRDALARRGYKLHN